MTVCFPARSATIISPVSGVTSRERLLRINVSGIHTSPRRLLEFHEECPPRPSLPLTFSSHVKLLPPEIEALLDAQFLTIYCGRVKAPTFGKISLRNVIALEVVGI